MNCFSLSVCVYPVYYTGWNWPWSSAFSRHIKFLTSFEIAERSSFLGVLALSFCSIILHGWYLWPPWLWTFKPGLSSAMWHSDEERCGSRMQATGNAGFAPLLPSTFIPDHTHPASSHLSLITAPMVTLSDQTIWLIIFNFLFIAWTQFLCPLYFPSFLLWVTHCILQTQL